MNDTPNPYESSHATLEDDTDKVVQRGQTIVLFILAFTISISLLVIAFFATSVGLVRPTQLVRILLTLGIAIALYRGHRWARYLFVFLYGLGGAAMLFAIPKLYQISYPPLIAISLIMGIGYTACAITLVVSPSVGRFLDHQWRRRNGRR